MTDLAVADRRARRKQKTRDQIVDAAVELFISRGYDATTVDQIAAAADVARGTFFNYFPVKEDVTHAWIERRRDEVRDTLIGTSGSDVIDRMVEGFAAIAKLYDSESALRRPMVRTWMRCGGPFGAGHGRTADVIQALLEDAQIAGQLSKNLDTLAAGRAIQDVYIGALCRWAASDRDSLKRHLRPAIDLMIPTLRH